MTVSKSDSLCIYIGTKNLFSYIGLTINFRSLDYDVVENDLMITVYMTIRETQRNFILILRPTDIDAALLESAGTSFDLNSFVGPAYTEAQTLEKATPGQVFKNPVRYTHLD